jgi:RNA polymerase sigma-70 factor (ECF subfamily)
VVDGTTDAARFEQLFRANYGRVLAYARRRASRDAEDVAAETFLIAWRRLEAVPRNELPWLLAVARRVLANQRRRSATQERAVAGAASEPVFPAELHPGLDPSLRRALLQLNDKDRELLTLIAWDGLAPAEAGQVLGLSSVGARVRLHRARRRLEGLLRPPTTKEPRWKTTGSTF